MSDAHDASTTASVDPLLSPELSLAVRHTPLTNAGKKRAATPSAAALANLPPVPKRRSAPGGAAAARSVAAGSFAAMGAGQDLELMNPTDDIHQAYAELQQAHHAALADNARLQQLSAGSQIFLDQDYQPEDDHGAAAAASGSPFGPSSSFLPPAARPPPPYAFQAAPASLRAAPAVYARPLSLLGGPGPGLGAALQGAHAAQVQGQILLNSHSFDTYTKADPAAARCLSNTLNVRDTLSIALHTAASVLVNISSIAHARPLYAPLMDLAQAVASVLPGTKEVVLHLSQKMLFQGREIGPIALQLREDLAVYNALNPESPLTSKEFRDLQNMSKPEFR